MRRKKILVRGPALSQTGYGEQCRFALRALRTREDLFDIYLLNIPWGASNWIFEDNEERQWLDELIIKAKSLIEEQNRNPNLPVFDISLQVTIPNELQKMARYNILYTAGIETDRVAQEWIAKCHQFADKIIVISEHAKSGFKIPIKAENHLNEEVEFVLEKPISVIGYPVKNKKTVDLNLDLETDFNFLVMAQWGPRKNLPNTVAWFCEEFKNDENIGLILKTFSKGNSIIDKHYTELAIKQVLNHFPDRKCKIYFLHGYMNEEELHSLLVNDKVKAMLNFGHGEGYGLPLFEAAYSGLPVITHDFGGQKDFLYAPKKGKNSNDKLKPHFLKINYDLKPVQKEVLWKGVVEPDMQWAFPNKNSCKVAMREIFKNYGLYKGQAKRLKSWIETAFNEEEVYKKFVENVTTLTEEQVFQIASESLRDAVETSLI